MTLLVIPLAWAVTALLACALMGWLMEGCDDD